MYEIQDFVCGTRPCRLVCKSWSRELVSSHRAKRHGASRHRLCPGNNKFVLNLCWSVQWVLSPNDQTELWSKQVICHSIIEELIACAQMDHEPIRLVMWCQINLHSTPLCDGITQFLRDAWCDCALQHALAVNIAPWNAFRMRVGVVDCFSWCSWVLMSLHDSTKWFFRVQEPNSANRIWLASKTRAAETLKSAAFNFLIF